jgi:hypothetical protein
MSIVPGPYDIHGWHPFISGWQGIAWCATCDCLDVQHVSHEEYELRREYYESEAARYHILDAEERYRELNGPHP